MYTYTNMHKTWRQRVLGLELNDDWSVGIALAHLRSSLGVASTTVSNSHSRVGVINGVDRLNDFIARQCGFHHRFDGRIVHTNRS